MMLAQSRRLPEGPAFLVQKLQEQGGWIFGVKCDGIRAVITITRSGVVVMNRRDADITWRYPETDGLRTTSAVLDGEIVVLGKDGLPDFDAAHKRDAQRSPRAAKLAMHQAPAVFMPFDVLELDGESLTGLRLSERLAILELDILPALPAKLVRPVPHGMDGVAMWKFVEAHKVEGLVAKRLASTYQDRRSPDWVKIKRQKTATVLVSGCTKGLGDRAGTFGALEIAVLRDNQIVNIGHVGTGFSRAELTGLRGRLEAGELLTIEVEFLELATSGQLRFPVYRCLRTDVSLNDCTYQQLV